MAKLHIATDVLVGVIVAYASHVRDCVEVSIRDGEENHNRRCADQKMRMVWLSLAEIERKCTRDV